MGAMIDHLGEAKAESGRKGVKANLAREPKGGDTDQIKARGRRRVRRSRLPTPTTGRASLRSDKPDEKAIAERVGIILPNQASWGTHVNISGAGVLKNAPNRDAAIRFLEYLASDEAQRYFADGNNEWPVVPTVQVSNPALAALGEFKFDPINVAVLGRNQPTSQKVFDRVAWK